MNLPINSARRWNRLGFPHWLDGDIWLLEGKPLLLNKARGANSIIWQQKRHND